MNYTIIDCYTDEPSGLGVPPYLGTFPRYIYGALTDVGNNPIYLTIDDIRLWKKYNSIPSDKSKEIKTNKKIYNLTKNYENVEEILKKTTHLIIIAGINVPGKYLSAVPGRLSEVTDYIKDLRCYKILTGPAALLGSIQEGGKKPEKYNTKSFDLIDFNYLNTNYYDEIKAQQGAQLIQQIPWPVIAEIETGKGCDIGKCSFCTEPLKSKVQFRLPRDIIEELKALKKQGVEHFRFGKQTCFFSYQNGNLEEIEKILKAAHELGPKTLHIDNVNPNKIVGKDGEKIVKLIVKYCTPGNTTALGIESFDKEVIKKNSLNTTPQIAYKAIKLINKLGVKRGKNGMPKLLPGINILFGLIGENKNTHQENMKWLNKILDENLLLRRINIRQVTPFEGTKLDDLAGTKFIKKNKKHYWSWRKQIRREIDYPMLKKLVPEGTILKDVRMEIYDGKTTFGRQFGTYPLVIGIKGKRLKLNEFYEVKVVDYMLRSIIGEVIQK
ncbi:radical SAM protein [Candidatus Woesearchaeota archaeon]|nr:radical SAM protein [Candidatus Woesearchaeota archaeon]